MPSATAARPALFVNSLGRYDELLARGPEWYRALRAAGRARFEEQGLPDRKSEAWRTTNLAPLARTGFEPPRADFDGELPEPGRWNLGGARLVFANGCFVPELSSSGRAADGLWIGSLERAIAEHPERVRSHLSRRDPSGDGAFGALNAALHEDGAVVLAQANARPTQPVQIVHVTGGGSRPIAAHPRTLVVAARGSHVRVVETYVGADDGEYLCNAVSDVLVEEQARVDHHRVQHEGLHGFHISSVRGRQARDSRYRLHQIDFGGRLVRHDAVAVLDGEGADCRLFGLCLADGQQHVDNHTVLDHARPHCTSRELYKGILAGGSRTVFNGRIVVREGAQQTNAIQSNRNLLLSADAVANSRPQLEIYADDVKCTHAATVGRLDEDAVFYLRSRGLGDVDARRLLINAFAGEVLDQVEIAALRERLEHAVAARLPGAGTGGNP
jgi:Fe-S cluster assembly protein SufD